MYYTLVYGNFATEKGRAAGALWPALLHYLFPSQYFGFVFGAMILVSATAKGFNIALFHFIQQSESYRFASLLVGCLSTIILTFSFLVGSKARSANDEIPLLADDDEN